MSPHYLQTACKHRSGPTLFANKKIQAIPMKALEINKFTLVGVRQRFLHFRAIRFTGLAIRSVEGVK
jgi:hypothetical protein